MFWQKSWRNYYTTLMPKGKTIKKLIPLKARLRLKAYLSSNPASTTSHLGTQSCVTSEQCLLSSLSVG